MIDIVRKANGSVDFVKVKAVPELNTKLKGFIHWISKAHSTDAIVRIYNYLFTEEEVGDNWLEKLNPNSLIEKKNAKVWNNIANSVEYDRY